MRRFLIALGAATMLSGAAQAGNQSSNTSSNSSSNNGVVRERVVDSYCEDGYCWRSVRRNVYRDDRRYRDNRRYRYNDRYRYERNRRDDDNRYYRHRDRDDNDDD